MVPGAPLVDPPDLNPATPGDLTVQLRVTEQDVMISGKKVRAETYNGSLVGPTLHAAPGQRVTLQLINELGTPTNLHFHGLHVSPEGNSDNVYLSNQPGQTLTYQLDIPADHAQGTYWYHAHEMCAGKGQSTHTMSMTDTPATARCDGTESQVGAGLSGTIIVGDVRESLPAAYRGVTAHTLALKDTQISKDNSIVYPEGVLEPRNPTVRLVNGQYQPTITLKAGETQLWRIANEGYAIVYDLQLDGATFTVVSEDGTPVAAPTQATHLLMPPGSRRDVLVTAGAAGSTWLRTLPYVTGPPGGSGDEYPDTPLMKVDVAQSDTGPAATGPAGMAASPRIDGPIPGSLPDMSKEPVAQSRNLELNDNGESDFYINGKMFDHHSPTFTTPATLGTVEEWTLTNISTHQNHPFHLHTAPFQVLSMNGVAPPSIDYKDVVNVPAAVDGVPGKVVIRIRFADYPGKWNFHCHVTGHEQNGMMGYMNVIAAGATG